MLNIKEAAEFFGVTQKTIQKMIDSGDLEAIIVSPSKSQKRKRLRISEDELREYITQNGIYIPD